MSSPRYKVNRLSADELKYELAVRGLSEANVDSMRKSLRTLLKLELEGSSIEFPPHPFAFDDDSSAICNKIAEVQELLDSLDVNDSSLCEKINSKIYHLIGRVNRCNAVTSEDKSVKTQLTVKILNLRTDFDKAVKVFNQSLINQSLGVPDLGLLNVDDDVSSDEEATSQPQASSSLVVSPTIKSVPVSQWNLTFSGEDHLSLNAFLIAVDEKRFSRNVSIEELFRSAIDLFRGKALVWFRANRKHLSDWNSLVALLRAEFQPPDYNDKLFEEIKNRTQGPNETMGIYLAYMENLFDRLTIKVPETTKLKILLNNLHPFYQTQLGLETVSSRDELLRIGRLLEARKAVVDKYHLPPSRKSNEKLLEPDLACTHTADLVSEVQPSSSSIVCWNCNKSGHISSTCPVPRKLKCFKCGKFGFTVRTCPKCSRAGNGRERN